eukprot:5939524-Pleurochrysis_carterae.AAC.1
MATKKRPRVGDALDGDGADDHDHTEDPIGGGYDFDDSSNVDDTSSDMSFMAGRAGSRPTRRPRG